MCLCTLSCGLGGGSPAVSAPDLPGFRRDRLVDVLAADDIPAITRPSFESDASAGGWLGPDAPVIVVPTQDGARAYPLAILVEHEIVDDTIDGRPVAITYSPLTNAAIVFERTSRSLTLTFGQSGKLYQSDMVMYDHETRSLWLQLAGRAIEGQLKGETLRELPSVIVSFGDFRTDEPGGEVLARPGGRPYAITPYPEYDSRAEPYVGFFRGKTDARLPAMERVVGVMADGAARAYPYDSLRARGNPAVLNEEGYAVFWGGSTRSPLNVSDIASGRIVGSSGVFDRRVRGRTLTFEARAGRLVDRETGSAWSLLGRARSGPLKGTQLAIVPHVDAFWFAWASFEPQTAVGA